MTPDHLTALRAQIAALQTQTGMVDYSYDILTLAAGMCEVIAMREAIHARADDTPESAALSDKLLALIAATGAGET